MKKIWTSLSNHKNLWTFLLIIMAFGIAVGIYFGILSKTSFQNTISNYALTLKENTTHFSISHFAILSTLLISSFFLIGIPLAIAYFFYEGLSLGFCITLFIANYGWNGLFYMLIFFALTRLFFLLIFGIFLSKLLKIGKGIIFWIIYKKNQKDYIFHIAINCIILILVLLCYDLFFDLIGIKLVRYFGFLLS